MKYKKTSYLSKFLAAILVTGMTAACAAAPAVDDTTAADAAQAYLSENMNASDSTKEQMNRSQYVLEHNAEKDIHLPTELPEGLSFAFKFEDGAPVLFRMISENQRELTKQISQTIGEAVGVRYRLENVRLEIAPRYYPTNRMDCLFYAGWVSTRQPEDDPMIQGLYQAARSLDDPTEQAYALEIADSWLAELQSWPETEQISTPIVVMIAEGGLQLFYPYYVDGTEKIVPLEEMAAEHWTENEEDRRSQGTAIIDEAIRLFRENRT